MGLISRRAFFVTMLSSMFWVTRVSPRSKKRTLAGRSMNLPGPGRLLNELGLLQVPRIAFCDYQHGLREDRFCVVRKKFLPPFFLGCSRQLNLFWASLPVHA